MGDERVVDARRGAEGKPDLDDGTGDDTHHIVEKTVSANDDSVAIFGQFFEFCRINRPNGIFDFTARRRERGEIVRSDRFFERDARVFFVEFFRRERHVRAVSVDQRNMHARNVKIIDVRLSFGGKLRLERIGYEFRFLYAYVSGQLCIDRKGQPFVRKLALQIEMRLLVFCVYAGVRPSASVQGNGIAEYLFERVRKYALHRALFRLNLPPRKIRSVIFYREKYSHKTLKNQIFAVKSPKKPIFIKIMTKKNTNNKRTATRSRQEKRNGFIFVRFGVAL